MTPEQQAAYIMSQSACAMAEIAGMQAENQHRISQGYSIAIILYEKPARSLYAYESRAAGR